MQFLEELPIKKTAMPSAKRWTCAWIILPAMSQIPGTLGQDGWRMDVDSSKSWSFIGLGSISISIDGHSQPPLGLIFAFDGCDWLTPGVPLVLHQSLMCHLPGAMEVKPLWFWWSSKFLTIFPNPVFLWVSPLTDICVHVHIYMYTLYIYIIYVYV